MAKGDCHSLPLRDKSYPADAEFDLTRIAREEIYRFSHIMERLFIRGGWERFPISNRPVKYKGCV